MYGSRTVDEEDEDEEEEEREGAALSRISWRTLKRRKGRASSRAMRTA
jgi:hypothetical protein